IENFLAHFYASNFVNRLFLQRSQNAVSDGISFSLTLPFARTGTEYRQGSKDHRNLGSRACTQRRHLIQ
ncbi:hypothetical protein, partial [Neisseria meningitidis]